MKEIKSPLIYPGSKGTVVDELLPLFPDNFVEYREPFIGSASIFLAARQKYGDSKKYWINDLNYELYNFFFMCQSDVNAVIKQILKWKNEYVNRHNGGKELFYELKRKLNVFNSVELAAAYYILNRSAFSGGSLVSGFSKDHFDNTFTEDRIRDLTQLTNLLHGVRITNLDYEQLVKYPAVKVDNKQSCDEKNIDENVFVMLDPPYAAATDSGLYGKGGNKGRNLHKSFDHLRFANVMKECKYNWLVTYDDSPLIRKLFSFASQKSWTFTHRMRKDKVGKELLISNFGLKDVVDTKQIDIESAWG